MNSFDFRSVVDFESSFEPFESFPSDICGNFHIIRDFDLIHIRFGHQVLEGLYNPVDYKVHCKNNHQAEKERIHNLRIGRLFGIPSQYLYFFMF